MVDGRAVPGEAGEPPAPRSADQRPLPAVTGPQGVDGVGDDEVGPLLAQVLADLQEAADVAREDRLRPRLQDVLRLAPSQRLRHLRLSQVVAAGRPAALLALGK